MRLPPSGKAWLLLLAGPGIGFLHLMGVYGLKSANEAPWALDETATRIALAVGTLAALVVNGAVATAAWRNRLPRLTQDPKEAIGFWRVVIGVGALISLVTVIWQGLPALMFD